MEEEKDDDDDEEEDEESERQEENAKEDMCVVNQVLFVVSCVMGKEKRNLLMFLSSFLKGIDDKLEVEEKKQSTDQHLQSM